MCVCNLALVIGKSTVHQTVSKLKLVKDLSTEVVALGVAYYARRQLYSYVLLVLILKDVLMLVTVSVYILLAELLSVRVEAIIHRTDECGRIYRIRCCINVSYVIFLNRRYVLAYSVYIIHLFVENVKGFYQVLGCVVEISILCLLGVSVSPLLSYHVSQTVIGKRLLCSVGVFHTLKAVSTRLVFVCNEIIITDVYACQITVCVIAHSISLSVTASYGNEVVINIISVADRTAICSSYVCGSACVVVFVFRTVIHTVDHCRGLGRYRVVFVLCRVAPRVYFLGLVVACVAD